jgi:MoaA/NifB/PqqE/SkfB family radical SAM enzyme
MTELTDNKYNSEIGRDQRKLKIWRNAGLLLTYKCNAACEFCYYCCSPNNTGLMTVDTAVAAWRGLRRLAGNTAKIHLTGGEPFMYFDRLCEILEAAKKENLGKADLIETNGYWAEATEEKDIDSHREHRERNIATENTEDTERENKKSEKEQIDFIKDRLSRLDKLGMRRLKISTDPFHLEYVGIQPVRLLAKVATDILGKDRVMVRWEKYLEHPVQMKDISRSELEQNYLLAMEDYPARLTGRAASSLGSLAALQKKGKTIEELSNLNCSGAFLGAKGVHIDPFGNVFSGTCSGIIIGNVNQTGLDDIWKGFDPREKEVISTLFESGPAGLLAEAIEAGYEPGETYADKSAGKKADKSAKQWADKCHLCTSIRQFFLVKGKYKKVIGPNECYEKRPSE